jgi:hypothetical protein
MDTVFVYYKEKEIKVLNLEDAKLQQYYLTENGWVHTATLDSCIFIEHLFNCIHDSDRLTVIKCLSIA